MCVDFTVVTSSFFIYLPCLDFVLLSTSELQTSLLPPRMYYELYMVVLGELGRIENFFMNAHHQSTPIVDIYQRVQGETDNKLMAIYV